MNDNKKPDGADDYSEWAYDILLKHDCLAGTDSPPSGVSAMMDQAAQELAALAKVWPTESHLADDMKMRAEATQNLIADAVEHLPLCLMEPWGNQ